MQNLVLSRTYRVKQAIVKGSRFRVASTVFTEQVQNVLVQHHRSMKRCSSTHTSSHSIRPQVEAKYYKPRKDRNGDNCHYQFEDHHKDRLVKVNRFCPTRELSYTPRHWELHKHPYRRLRHVMKLWSGSALRRLAFPDLAVTASVAAFVSYYNEILVPEAPLLMDGSAMSGATTAIGLLAAFRLNASYGRYEEARIFWGEINNSSRDLASNSLMWLKAQDQKKRMLKLIQAFPVTLQFHLNEKGGHYTMKRSDPNFEEQKYAEFYNELHDIYNDETNLDFIQICDTYRQNEHVPLAVTSCMRVIIAQNMDYADPMYNREMDEQVQRLVGCIGMCERVLRTPIPTCFTRHTSRLFFLWSNLLPFAMYSSLGPLAVIPGSVLISFAVQGIEDIGVQLEEPFNILPLRQYSDGIFSGINSIESSFLLAHRSTNMLPITETSSNSYLNGSRAVNGRDQSTSHGDAGLRLKKYNKPSSKTESFESVA
jgi:ion channel-forming bestrophin family protein